MAELRTWPGRAIYLLLGVVLALGTISWFLYDVTCHSRLEDEEHFYQDLTSGSGYTYSEVNNFVTEFDPFYKWAFRSSLPTIYQEAVKDSSPEFLEKANAAYQKSSAWRVISKWNDSSSNATKLYVSSEPHILGGEFKQDSHNWVWRMKTNWGISMRICLSYGNFGFNRSCLWTTPIVATENKDLVFLYIGIPYRTPSDAKPTLANAQYSPNGMYLSNYAGNARTDFSTRQKLSKDQDQYYLTNTSDIPECQFAPYYYDCDALSYLAFPDLQCGCSSSVCVVATKNIPSQSWGLFDYNASCNGLKSYWAWNTGGNKTFTFVVHNISSNMPLPIYVESSFTPLDISTITKENLLLMQNLTSCMETTIAQTPVPTPEELAKKCYTEGLDLYLDIGKGKFGSFISSYIWYVALDMEREEKNAICVNDLSEGQLRFKKNICLKKLDAATSRELNLTIKSLVEVSDIRLKQQRAWNNVADSKREVYLSMFTGVVSLLGVWAAVISKRLMDIEIDLQEYLQITFQKFKRHMICLNFSNRAVLCLKFSYRAVLLLASAFAALFAVYDGTGSGIKEQSLVQAQTLTMSMNQGITILVTTTATSQIEPIWNAFIVFCVFTCLVIVASLYWVGHILENDQMTTPDDPFAQIPEQEMVVSNRAT